MTRNERLETFLPGFSGFHQGHRERLTKASREMERA